MSKLTNTISIFMECYMTKNIILKRILTYNLFASNAILKSIISDLKPQIVHNSEIFTSNILYPLYKNDIFIKSN